MADQAAGSATGGLTARDAASIVRHGDCLKLLPDLPEATVDAIVCDPPYGIDFLGEKWDGQAIRHAARTHTGRRLSPGEGFQAWATQWTLECARVLKPGAHLAAFAAPRTAHRLASALEDAGLQLRDTLMWLYGQGLPKSRRLPGGQGTSLKPAYEPVILARKPLDSTTVEENHRRHGTGTLNTEACAIPDQESNGGRWPANVLLTHHPECRDGRCAPDCPAVVIDHAAASTRPGTKGRPASRIFYCPKASRQEREAGCEQLPRRRRDLFPNATGASPPPPEAANSHPTVKPIALMRWLVRLITPAGGLVLDPFCGSGSTGIACLLEHRRFLGIELDATYHAIAQARISHWAANAPAEAPEPTPPMLADDQAQAAGHEPRTEPPPSLPVVPALPPQRQLVGLEAETVEAIAQRVAELLDPPPPAPPPSRALLSAAQVAAFYGVDRGWVYEHAEELGACRLGDGQRPRLRFDPDLVAERLNETRTGAARRQAHPPRRPGCLRRSRRIHRHPGKLLEIRGQPEVSSPEHKTGRPGGAPTPPATAPKTTPPAR